MQGSDPYLVLTQNGETPLLFPQFVSSHFLTAQHTWTALLLSLLRAPMWPPQGHVSSQSPSPGLILTLAREPRAHPSPGPSPGRCPLPGAGASLVSPGCQAPGWGWDGPWLPGPAITHHREPSTLSAPRESPALVRP